ncbi:MAG: chloride channel protein [Alphaproteobacteria bacterium]|nr:chloride channel protein [Alphaproteobacteria bacterium]
MSVLAVLCGLLGGLSAIVFRELIELLQWVFLGFTGELVASDAARQPWWRMLLGPLAGGLLVGLFVHFVCKGRPAHGVANVIEANALRGGFISLRDGLASAFISAASIAAGASVGREGPAVHLGAMAASVMSTKLGLRRAQMRTLLGCGVASAVAASFNAPIAGVFFALEVVIGHYALNAFAPIVLASVVGTIVSRLYYGDYPAFIIPDYYLVSFWEFPAFLILGFICAATAIAILRSYLLALDLVEKITLPRWSLPAIAGGIVGVVGLWFPEILGVGYEATDQALRGQIDLDILMALVVLKIAATVMCMAMGFGGGIFSPALFIGAMVGGAFGLIAQMPFPELASDQGAYTLVGMGAVAGAVLGAPISTVLMVFELTGDYALTIVVMLVTAIATVSSQAVMGRSFFLAQLERRGIRIRGAYEVPRMADLRVRDLIRRTATIVTGDTPASEVRTRLCDTRFGVVYVVNDDGSYMGTISYKQVEQAFAEGQFPNALAMADTDAPSLTTDTKVEAAMALFEKSQLPVLPILSTGGHPVLVGALHERDVLLAYNRELERLRAEEHGEEPRRP